LRLFILFILFMVFSASMCQADILIVGNLAHEKTVAQGETYNGAIMLSNNGDTPRAVRAYQTDYSCTADGRHFYEKPSSQARSNAAWITVSPQRLTIAPHENATINYTVKVPQDQELKGTYWSLVMVEPIPETSPEVAPPEKEKVKIGIQTVVRYAVQIITQFKETGEKKISFMDRKLVVKDNRVLFQLDVANTGEHSMTPLVWAELYNKEGTYMGRFESMRQRIYPGCSTRNEIDLTNVPRGEYKALVVADNGDENVFGAEYSIELK